MSCADCAFAVALPLLAESWTGWPHAAPPAPISIVPIASVSAAIASCWQVAPVDVGWQLQPSEPWWACSIPMNQLPEGSVMVAVSSLVAAVPPSSIWNHTWVRPHACCTLTLAVRVTPDVGGGLDSGVLLAVGDGLDAGGPLVGAGEPDEGSGLADRLCDVDGRAAAD